VSVRMTGKPRDITSAINALSPAYHGDFVQVRTIARHYLTEAALSANFLETDHTSTMTMNCAF